MRSISERLPLDQGRGGKRWLFHYQAHHEFERANGHLMIVRRHLNEHVSGKLADARGSLSSEYQGDVPAPQKALDQIQEKAGPAQQGARQKEAERAIEFHMAWVQLGSQDPYVFAYGSPSPG